MKNTPEEYRPVYREVMLALQKKHNHMVEVCRLTTELESALQRDDRVSTQMLLVMRQEEIEGIRKCDKNMQLLIESTPPGIREWLRNGLEGRIPQSEELTLEENQILRISANIRGEWEKTVRIDRYVNQKLAGEESFYHQREAE